MNQPTLFDAPTLPYSIRKVKLKHGFAEVMTFTGTTAEEYDRFLDDRFIHGFGGGWMNGSDSILIGGITQRTKFRRNCEGGLFQR